MRFIHWAAIVFAFVIYLIATWPLRGWIIDDAGITFAYAKSLALGYGLVAQPGASPVEGFSNLLWVIVLAPLIRLHLFDPFITSKLLSFALILVSFVILYRLTLRLTGGSWLAGLAALLLLSINTSFVGWTCSGLENPLFVVLIAAAVWLTSYYVRRTVELKTAAILGLLFAAIALTRPDGIVYALIFPVMFLLTRPINWKMSQRRLRPLIGFVAVAGMVYGGYLLFRHWYFGVWLPNTYYAKGGPSPLGIIPALTLTSGYAEKFKALSGSLFGDLLWVTVPIGLLVGISTMVVRRLWKRELTILCAFTFIAYFVQMIMPEDWMGEFRFATPFFMLVYVLTAVVAAFLLRLIHRSKLRVFVTVGILLVAFTAAAIAHFPRLRTFYNNPPVNFARIANDYAFKYDRWIEALGLDTGSVLLPDVGAPLYYSKNRVYDLACLTDRVIARTLYRNRAAFHNYIFDVARPTIIHTHGNWTYRARLDEDPRFREQYVAVKEWPDKWVKKNYNLDLMSGDYVRRDAVVGREHLLQDLDR